MIRAPAQSGISPATLAATDEKNTAKHTAIIASVCQATSGGWHISRMRARLSSLVSSRWIWPRVMDMVGSPDSG